jgi:cation:H+ antiporter
MESPDLKPRRQIAIIGIAMIATTPGVVLSFTHPEIHPIISASLYGMAIVGAAFMLAWAAEVVQLDIAAGLAIALLALIAVLPEYAVDFVLTASAGTEFLETGAAERFGHLALANMTGGNQLLIGFGWPLVVLLGTWRVRKLKSTPAESEGATEGAIHLARGQSVDIAFLAVATLYGMTLSLKESLTLVDAGVLVTIYVLYLMRLSNAPPEEPHLVGPSAYIGSLPRRRRRIINYTGFVVAAAVIIRSAEPFAHAIIEMGEEIGVSDFLLIKWIAPTASEAPELLVAALFAWRLASRTGLGALVSSKVNQWTLLVGTLPIVFAVFSRSFHGLPLDEIQRVELFVTASQSVFAVAILASRSMSTREALLMFGLFMAQVAESLLAEFGFISETNSLFAREMVAVAFILAAVWALWGNVGKMRTILRDGFRASWSQLSEEEPVRS